LKYLDIRGSGFTGITLADSAPVETLYLNNPTTLSFSNLSKISTFSIGYDNLNTLYLNNIDDSTGINSKTLVEGSATKLNPYNLQNVKWVIEDSAEISDTNIDVLDILLAEGKTPYSPTLGSRIDKSLALSGTLTVKDTAYSALDSEALYEKYAIDPDYNFPNLDLIFEGSARLYNV